MDPWSKVDYSRFIREASMVVEKLPEVIPPSGSVRPDMRYCSRSRCFHPDPGTKHISVPPQHMTKSYAPDFEHDITTLQIQGYNISYNRHTTASNTIQ